MTRTRAGLTHLGLSALVATTVLAVIYFVWFPDVLFEGAGGRDLFFIIASVDVTIGPLLTFIVFKSGKKGLKFDLAVIATLQLAALSYGVWAIFEARPVYIVYVKDRFELVRANEIPEENLEKVRAKGQHRLPLWGPKLIGVQIPKDSDEAFKLMISAMNGVDIQSYPEYYVPYDEVRAEARAHGKPLEKLRGYNKDRAREVDQALAALGRKEAEVLFLPMRAGKRDLAAIIDAKDGQLLRITTLKPWE